MNTLRSFTETVVTTPTDTFPISFEYDEKYDAVHVFLNDVAVEDLGYTVSQVNAVTLKVEPAIPEGTVRIERETDIDKMMYIFDAGALFIDQNVDADFKQIVHSQQEVRDGFIKLRGDVLPLVHGLQEALKQAQEASEAAQEAANAAEVAATQTQYYLKYYSPDVAYPLNARLMLDNGDIVKSTVPNNTANPNTDMTGWVNVSKGTIYTVGSVAEMLGLNPSYQNSTIVVKATGAMYQYNPNDAGVNNKIYILNGWNLIGYHDVLLATLAGIKGDGTDEKDAAQALLDAASSLRRPINMCGLSFFTSPLTATGDLEIFGGGEIRLYAGSNGTLINSAYNLVIKGVGLDQNKVNNSGGTISAESHCTIKHSGDVLELRGVKIKPSTSINVVTRAKKTAIAENVEIDGGMIGFFAIPSANAKVDLIGGEYKNAHLYDNIQILNGTDVAIERVKSHDSARSCIVVSNSTTKARIFANIVYGAKVDGANQGGWGIAVSVNSQDSIISLNSCYGNQRGCISVDTYPDSGPSVDNRIIVSGNLCNGTYNETYGTTGIILNNAKHSNVYGNIIYKVAQGMIGVDCDYSNIQSNAFIDCRDYFANFTKTNDVKFDNNLCDGCPVTGAAALRFIDSNRFKSTNNTIKNLTGVGGFVYRVSNTATGTTRDWLISDNDVYRNVAGSGYIFHILGNNNTGGKIRRNNFKADGVTGWQWYILSDNLAAFSTHENELESTGTGYITSGANVTAGDDTINGSRNVWSATPTAFKSRTGQIATIAKIVKSFDGTNWNSANVVAVTYDPPSIPANGGKITTTVTATGAVVGDFAQATFSVFNADIDISAIVTATNQVTVKFRNNSASAIDLASGTLRVRVT